MIPVSGGVRVWIASGHTDMRKGMPGLALLVQEHFKRDPFAGDVFVFRGTRRFADQGDLARRDRIIALRQAAGPGPVHLASDHGRGGGADHGADELSLGRDRLA